MAGQGIALQVSAGSEIHHLFDDDLNDDERKALAEYAGVLDELVEKDSPDEITNGSPFHARLVLTKLFQCASSNVSVYSGTLRRLGTDAENGRNGRIWAYPRLIAAARKFLRKPNTKLSILIQNCVDGDPKLGGMDHPFLRALFEDSERRGEFRLVVATGHKTRILPITPKHFAVADEKIYRLETKNNGIWATASFNAPRVARLLSGYFQQLLDRLRIYAATDSVFDITLPQSYDGANIRLPPKFLCDQPS